MLKTVHNSVGAYKDLSRYVGCCRLKHLLNFTLCSDIKIRSFMIRTELPLGVLCKEAQNRQARFYPFVQCDAFLRDLWFYKRYL